MENQVLENIMTRTSVRAFKDQAVSPEIVETLLRAAMAAPSAKNRQLWEFVVVDDRVTLDALAEELRYAKMLFSAPLAIVVGCHSKCEDGSDFEFWAHDASAATENILLAAHSLGLGSVWTAAADSERSAITHRILGIPDEINTLCVIALGYPAETRTPKDKWHPEKIHYNKY